MTDWPLHPYPYPTPYTAYQKPKVGLAVVCKCPGNSLMQCLLQKRGPNSASPNKWSFPGGRLEHPGDLEDDGAVGTKRELEVECGGGNPPGLPPLIHIECCKSGKQKQTLYHVYVVDTSSDKEWENWQPRSMNGKGAEIDISPTELIVNGQSFPSANGYCWVDMSALVQECYDLTTTNDLTTSDLQHGLVRWVQNYGEHVLKTLIARSPKLPHHRRYSNSSSSSSGGGTSNGIHIVQPPRPRLESPAGVKPPHRYTLTPRGPGMGMLHPPIMPFFRPPFPAAGSPTGLYYGLGPNPSQLSPPGGGGLMGQQGIILPIPSPGQQQGLIYVQPPTLSLQPSAGSPSTNQNSQPSSPGVPVPETSTTTDLIPSITTTAQTQGLPLPSHPHMGQQSTVNQLPASLFDQPSLTGVLPVSDHTPTSISMSQLLQTIAATSSGRLNSEPLLPNPPVHPPVLHHSNQHHYSRKEILCRHYVAGQCPYGEKCWFAHPDPLLPTQPPPQREVPTAFSPIPQRSVPSSPLHIQVPPNMWVNSPPNLPIDLAQFLASPPQSPLGAPLLPNTRLPVFPSVLRPRGGYHNYPGQQPLLFIRQPMSPTGRFPGGVSTLPFPGQFPAVPSDPVLKFSLLSEVVVRHEENDSILADISQLATRADHFYISYGVNVHDYKVLFGGNRSYQESSIVIERHAFPVLVSCLHCSKLQPSLLVIGTESGSIYTWDLRRAPHGLPLQIHITESSPPVTSLVHFMTSINAAQVIVAGNKNGTVSWYISQPPQKTYSLLFAAQCHIPHPVVSLQILGGILISGGQNGLVLLWSMQSQQPTIDSTIQAHSFSLTNIHVLDHSYFLTVGIGSSGQEDLPGHVTSHDAPHPPPPVPVDDTHVTGQQAIDSVTSELGQLAVGEDSPLEFYATLWQFNRPPKCLKSIRNHGDIVSTSFHHQMHIGNMFLAVGMKDGTVKIYNVPNFTVASELHFPEMRASDCIHVALNLSREAPIFNNAYFRNPFRDLILTTVWSDGKVMVCQVARQ